MKILITGICGFAGSVLARTLLEHRPGLQLSGIDNLSRKGSETNLEPLRQRGIPVQIGDICDPAALGALAPADYIIDCAANPSVLAGVDGRSSSLSVIQQNLYGTVNLLELCKAWNAGFILLSTSRVYSIPPLAALPLRESATRFEPVFQSQDSREASGNGPPVMAIPGLSPNGVSEAFSTAAPISLYGSSKLCSEALALEYGFAFGFPVWINRCGVLAGAGQFGKADQGIFSYWIHSWRAGQPLRYIGFGGSGKQVRDCLHPKDLAGVILQQINSSAREQARIQNLSGGINNSMSLLELSSWCRNRFGPSQSELDLANSDAHESRPYDIPWLVLDPSIAASKWNWEPATTLNDVVEEIAAHAENNPDWLNLSA
jgi:CDP-paratose 2-epimerase